MNALLAATLILITVGLIGDVSAEARPPNVILILADDLGYRDLGCQGHPTIRTPVLDKLAAGGLRLTGFHAGASVCTPSRMALLTGAYPVRLGWTQGVVGYKMGMHEGMSPEALTLAEIFRSEGYATAISGKWHLGDQPDTRPPAQGFASAYYLTHSNNQIKAIWRGDEIVEEPFDNRLLTEKLTAEAIRFVKANRDTPFFLYLPYTAPHFPVEAHPDWKGRSAFGAYGDVVRHLSRSRWSNGPDTVLPEDARRCPASLGKLELEMVTGWMKNSQGVKATFSCDYATQGYLRVYEFSNLGPILLTADEPE